MTTGAAPATLPAVVTKALAEAADALRRNDAAAAERCLLRALALAPRHAQARRLLGSALVMQGRHAEAVASLREAIALQPDDALAHNSLGNALGRLGDTAGAVAAFARACALAADLAPLWYNHAKALCEDRRNEEALPVLEQATRLAPDNLRAQFLHAHALRVSGRFAQAAQLYRQLVARHSAAEAWLGLANLKNQRFDADDVAAMERLARGPLDIDDRNSILFALARGYEDLGRHADAFRAYREGNASVRRHVHWDAARFSAQVDATLAAFTPPPRGASRRQGGEVVFIVSLPRAGSSLTEQILASHPQIDGAGELSDLHAVLQEESRRRGEPFPAWVAQASADDWQRLGADYLQRTARWRDERPRFTDKLPDNWRYVGAALAMLPEARIVVCRRDPVETALACFRQLFAGGGQPFSYDLDDIARHSRDFDRAVQRWRELYPTRLRVQDYEALVADSEAQIRALLAFCELPFDGRCLRFHETERVVRTASAGQVREPLRRDTARAANYASLLDPLRAALGLAPFAAAPK
ncbi:MAG: sulfotransferase [Proteobacteria bacterium]|uniref:tetratricopeptide repeat-containing sulfotransferase family protein n=1 Tax=Rudaea sp. TaxID=2136325 RepID=UPI001D8727B0|nr:sulfotransferase [Pseudomonadota bacterium]MBS0567536.1 sulfotransferase [Pseudomonadota bacterium]